MGRVHYFNFKHTFKKEKEKVTDKRKIKRNGRNL